LASGFENSPQLFHISRYGTKAIWFSPNDNEMEIKSVSLPSFEQQMAGVAPSSIKRILLDPEVVVGDIRAFDTDEVRHSDRSWIRITTYFCPPPF